ncbi:hypothetical protein Aci011_074 [Acinetobacter phage vB_AbaM_B09_Aci01-1]|uniref:Uncharacterized protein n=1 Tax=Acinetobacter phage vB_AbaM_B09_Aci01-1 TaxID=2315466 RepID=A0A386KMG9_9CAUD|nr:hypothetical protein HOU29_gp107 [Acinetobacter phage vB_AbaM_B09_Aci01-1]AYD85601.1 hypothetical protein Aci011_074 [Acinetobacter phage vB_AbaM_B09_Aci01-1]
MSKHINELATEIEAKRGAGRPSVDNESILDELLAKPETRQKLKDQFRYLKEQKLAVMAKQDIYKDDVKATKEVFGLSNGFITKAVDALVKSEVSKKMTEAAQFSDFLSVLGEDEEDEDSGNYDENDFGDEGDDD